jgi:enoyl-[acyl-carrier-protein] reductase (NADH)
MRRHDDAAMDETFRVLKEKWGTMDFLVHAIGFSNKDELEGRYIDTSADNFALTMNISVYSFTAVAKRAEAMLRPGGSLLTLTYYGAEKYVPNYNVMGVAKAALEASVRYLAADLGPQRYPRQRHLGRAPSRRWPPPALPASGHAALAGEANAPLEAQRHPGRGRQSALYLLSDLSSGVTGRSSMSTRLQHHRHDVDKDPATAGRHPMTDRHGHQRLAGALFHPAWRNRLEPRGALPGLARTSRSTNGRAQADRNGEICCRPAARDNRAAGRVRLVRVAAEPHARDDGPHPRAVLRACRRSSRSSG